MAVAGYQQRSLHRVRILHIRDEEGGAATFLCVGEVLQCACDIRSCRLGFERKQFADDMQHVALAFLGRDVFFDFVREEDNAHFIVVLDGREGQCGGNFGHAIALERGHRTEIATARHIDQQHHGQFALLLKHLDVRLVEAGGHVPVDRANIITGLVLSHLAESHTTTFVLAVVLSGEDVATETTGLDLNLADFL